MNASSLVKEIDCLNKDIDKCKGRLDNVTSKRNSCPPNCYCDKRTVMNRKIASNITTTRKKTSSATVTKTDITPHCYQEREMSEAVSNNNSQNVSDEICLRKNCGEQCQNTKKNRTYTSARCPREANCHLYNDNNNIEPVKLPKKCSHNKNEPSWGTILQRNSVDNMKENIYCQTVPTKDGYTQMKTSTSSSVASFVPAQTQAIYMKNRGVQCGELSFKKDKYSNYEPLNTIQYIIMNMKSKLKDDPSLESMLDEMELVLRRLPLDRGDSHNIDNLAKDYRSSSYERYLHPKPNFSKPKMRPSYGDVLNLEATYQELEATCKKLKKERDVAIEKASQKSVELVESMRREVETKAKLNETNSKIKEMSAKLETYTRSMEGLTEHVKRLQNENKDMERIRGQVAQLSSMMRDVTQENKSLLTELQLITIEKNKMEVALAIKEQELQKKSKELESMARLMSGKAKIKNVENQRPPTPEPVEYCDLIVNSCGNEKRDSPQLVCSSPNSSSSESMLRARLKSWVALSTISTGGGDVVARSENDFSISPSANRKRNKRTNTIKIGDTLFNSVQSSTEVQTTSQQTYQPQQQQQQQQQHQQQLQRRQQLTNNEKQRPDLNKIEKLKEEIRHMFSEMRELAQDVPSMPVVEFSSIGDSSEINWSEVSNSVSSCQSVSDLQQSEFNDLLNNYKS